MAPKADTMSTISIIILLFRILFSQIMILWLLFTIVLSCRRILFPFFTILLLPFMIVILCLRIYLLVLEILLSPFTIVVLLMMIIFLRLTIMFLVFTNVVLLLMRMSSHSVCTGPRPARERSSVFPNQQGYIRSSRPTDRVPLPAGPPRVHPRAWAAPPPVHHRAWAPEGSRMPSA